MFQIDRSKNRLRKLAQPSFSEVHVREREHLQEWIAEMPEALGETLGDELLIIQKEFDGFDGTRERLDLLALDRKGQLVIIENKLDDSGRDVVWQALKYAAYCSSLRKTEIVSIFQKYLALHNSEDDAASRICDFLGEDTLDEVILNEGHDQRVVFVAANFRREVTATVLWLREHQIDARCIKITPYQLGDELFVDLQQVIPPPEAADYMIRMVEKDTEEKTAKGVQRQTHQVRAEFWADTLEAMRKRNFERWQNISPSQEHWLSSTTGVPGCRIILVFLRHEIRVEYQFDRPNEGENKWLFDRLAERRDELDKRIADPLEWRRLDEKKVSMIVCRKAVEGYERDMWPDMIAWFCRSYAEMDAAFSPLVRELAGRMKPGGLD